MSRAITCTLAAHLHSMCLQVSQGFTFVSDTDTEVIPKLCQYVHNSSPPDTPLSEASVLCSAGHPHVHRVSWCPAAMQQLEGRQRPAHQTNAPTAPHTLSANVRHMQLVLAVMEQLEGAYALLIKSTHYPGELVACKRGSPLILGLRAAPKAAVASPGGSRDFCFGRFAANFHCLSWVVHAALKELAAAAPGGCEHVFALAQAAGRAGLSEAFALRPKAASLVSKRPPTLRHSTPPMVAGDNGEGSSAKLRAVEGGFECFLASDASAVVEHTKK